MPNRFRRVLALLLIAGAAIATGYGWSRDGNLSGIWWGTLLLEIACLFAATAVSLLARPGRQTQICLGTGLASVLIFVGAQHYARAARRSAMADGILPPQSESGNLASVEEIRRLFTPCFPGGRTDDFYELELGVVPASSNHPTARWLVTQPYPPMAGVSRGFLIARAYLEWKSSASANRANVFASGVAGLGFNPQKFLSALTAVSITPSVDNDIPMQRSDPSREAGPSIPKNSISVLAYPGHEIPEITEAALLHPGAIDIDPADLHEMNYGWEFVWISRKHPRVGLHTREGAGDLEGQSMGVSDFHGLHGNSGLSHLVYDFKVDRPGLYRLSALILPEADKCSNYPQASIDDSGYADLGHNDCIPFAWYDADWKGGSVPLDCGWHRLNLHFMQDGITIARFWLTPLGDAVEGPTAGSKSPPDRAPLELVLTRRSMALLEGDSADFGAWVRNPGRLNTPAVLEGELDPGRGRPLVKFHQNIQLSANEALKEFPLSLSLPKNLPAREMRVTVSLAVPARGLKVVRESTVVKPFPALLLGPIPRPHDKELSFFNADYLAPKAEDFQRKTAPAADTWGRYPPAAVSYYGLYDLNRAFGGSSYDGIFFSRAYIAVRLNSPKDGKYLFKIMGDDVVSVWLDGAHIYTSERKGPPIRYPGTTVQPLKAGEHLMVMHVDQTTGWWQGGVHLRTEDDDVCDIEGAAE